MARINRSALPALLCWALLPVAGCDSGEVVISSTKGTGHLAIHLTDKPLDMDTVQSVHVTIDSLVAFGVNLDGSDGDKVDLMPRTETFDLLALTGGVTTLLAEGDVPAGYYTRLRLGISDASLTFNDQTTAGLKIDSGRVDINLPFEVSVSSDMSVTLDFDAGASLHIVGTGSQKYILRPVVTPIHVLDPDPVPLPPAPGDPNGDPNSPV